MSSKPRILVLDIECAPHRVYTWGTYRQTIGINQIIEPGRMLCFAAKWLDSKQIIFKSEFHDSPEEMIESLWVLLDEADAVMGYNSDSFDLKWCNSEFLKYGLLPPSSYVGIDLLRTMRKNFREASNKLDYIVQKLDIGRKVKHYGFELWRDVLEGDAKAWGVMKRYNKQDVKITEDLYYELRPWVDQKLNFGLFTDESAYKPICGTCGSDNIEAIGTAVTKISTFTEYRCGDCGSLHRSRTRALPTNTGVLK